MISVACIMMQKDERELLHAWIRYHAALFGKHNLFIYDNGSTEPTTLRILDQASNEGISVNRIFNRAGQFTEKGEIFGELIRYLDKTAGFEFYFPIDCDEFVALRKGTSVVADQSNIMSALETLRNTKQALGISTSYYNVLGKEGLFFEWPGRKTFFRNGTFFMMDEGFHEGIAINNSKKLETDFTYIHYHHKPYAWLVESAKNKLKPFMNPDNEDELRHPSNANRLTNFINLGESEYMKRFAHGNFVQLSQFMERLSEIGLDAPFSNAYKGFSAH